MSPHFTILLSFLVAFSTGTFGPHTQDRLQDSPSNAPTHYEIAGPYQILWRDSSRPAGKETLTRFEDSYGNIMTARFRANWRRRFTRLRGSLRTICFWSMPCRRENGESERQSPCFEATTPDPRKHPPRLSWRRNIATWVELTRRVKKQFPWKKREASNRIGWFSESVRTATSLSSVTKPIPIAIGMSNA
jgi:hypothetical protein